MLTNYLKIAFRTMLRNKSYSMINILGLSIGIACCLILALYLQDEMSYDKHHRDIENIYRINTHFQTDKGLSDLGTTSPPVGVTMRDEIAEIETATRLVNPIDVPQCLIKYKDQLSYETNGMIADAVLFDVLTYEFKQGNPKKALLEANSVVITEAMAKKVFGNESALDKIISISMGGAPYDFKITGVIKPNEKSIIKANFFISMTSSSEWPSYLRSSNAMDEWAGQNFVLAFVKLKPNQSKDEVTKKMNQLLIKYGAEDMKALGLTKTLSLEPLKDIYLKSTVAQSPRITYLYVIASIAIFILLIACINFMNLSTAKATKRASEVGLRKVMGAFRSSLIKQFMGEALVIVFIAILFSLVLVQMILPVFNHLTDKSISFGTQNILYLTLILAAITITTGIVAGSYPALYLSSFQPAQVLKGKSSLGNASGWLRQSLVVFQFMIAIGLVCGMIIISQQLNFMQNKNLGFDSNAKIVLPLRTESARKNYELLKKELEKQTLVKSISATNYIPGSFIFSDMNFYAAGGTMDNGFRNTRNSVDEGYIEMMDIKMVAGRTFNHNRVSESKGNLILNRTAAKKFGFEPEQIIGQPIYFDWQGQKSTFEIIGVMEDYHQTSLKDEIAPLVFEMPSTADTYNFMVVSVKTEEFKAAIPSLEKKWKDLINDTPFEYSFLDQNIQKQYKEDRKISKIITTFTLIAMFISCLGLYGLSTYMAERRFKEIGIRKVMGASINQIAGLMSTEFIKLILIAFVIAVPIAWYVMAKWLQGFAYKTSISITVFIYAGMAAMVIALLTVSFESIRAAMANPTKSLKSE